MRMSLIVPVFLLFVSCDPNKPTAITSKVDPRSEIDERFSRKTAATIQIGTFEVVSDELVASDPCYPIDEKDLHGGARPARPGPWKATIVRIDAGDWGQRNAELLAVHSLATGTPSWEKQKSVLGVDSGQMGIFDRAEYSDSKVVPKDHPWKGKPIDPDQPWYSLCCEKTLEDPGAGVIPFGTVSSSGLGDGAYEWYLWKDQKLVVGVRIVFLPE